MVDYTNWLDLAALAVLVILAYRGYRQGLIIQLSIFVSVGLGLLGGFHLQDAAIPLLPDFGVPELQFAASFALVFAAIALSVNVVARLVRQVVHALFMGWIDRILGGLFGVLVGVQLLLVVVMLISRYMPEGIDWLQQSKVAQQLFHLVMQLLPLLPAQFSEFFQQHFGNML